MTETASPTGLSIQAARRIRRISVATVMVLAICAAVLSFSGLRLLALQAGFPPELAWMFPLIVDGLVLAGSLGVISAALARVRTTYFWFLTLLGVFISVVGNVASAPQDLLSQSVHAAPPLIFALSVEGLLKVYRHAVTRSAEVKSHHAQPPSVGEESDPEFAPVVVTEPRAVESPQPATSTRRPSQVARPTERSESATPMSTEPAVDPGRESKRTPGELPAGGGGTARQRLQQLLLRDPDITGAAAARQLNIDPSHARRLLRDLRASTAPPVPEDNEQRTDVSLAEGEDGQ